MANRGIWVAFVSLLAAAQAWPQSPPPRSASDITALLDTYKPDPQAVTALKAELAQPAPSEDSLNTTLLSYWEHRAMAAEALGLVALELEARRKLATLSKNMSYVNVLAGRELFVGSLAEGLRLHDILLRGRLIGARAMSNARMAMLLARQGNVKDGGEFLGNAESDVKTLLGTPDGRWYAKDWESGIEAARGALFGARGRMPEAEAAYVRAVELFREDLGIAEERRRTGRPYPDAQIHYWIDTFSLRLAEIQVQRGRFIDAELLLRERLGENLKRVGRSAPNTLVIAIGLASLYAEQGRFSDATALARAALDGMLKAGTPAESGYVLDTRLTLAKGYIGQERWREAVAEFRSIETAARASAAGHPAASGSAEIAIALVRAGDATQALEMMRGIVQRLEASLGVRHYRTGEARGVLAMALAKSGERDAALKAFREAIETMIEFEAQADETAEGGLRRLKLVWIIEGYLELLAERHRSGDTEAAAEAFRVADVARAQRVQRAVTSSAVRAAAGTPELAKLVREEQDLGHQVAAIYRFLGEQLLRPAEQQLPKVMSDMRARIERIATERSALLREIDKRFPAYSNLISPKPPTLAAARQGLREGEALIATYSAEEATYLWAMRRDSEVAFTTQPITRRELQARIGKLLEGVTVASAFADALPKFDVALAHELYKLLLEPVAAGWKGATSLLVVPHGPAVMLPFAVLPTASADTASKTELLFSGYRKVPWLVREVALTQFPSVNALVTLRAQPPARPGRLAFAGFGDPIFNTTQAVTPASTELASRGVSLSVRKASQTSTLASARLANLPRLPDTADEIRAIAQLLGMPEDEGVFLDRRANENEVKTRSLVDRRVLAFATHGLVAGDLDGLDQPALALTAPEVAGIDGDGLLTMEEVLALKLDADWVILSACNTAAGDGAGAEAVSGLGRAFFYAGARALLVSNWPVETVSARRLTTSTIERYSKAGTARAEALRQAMLELLDRGEATSADGKPLYAYAHPLFWAPFSVIGDGGGN